MDSPLPTSSLCSHTNVLAAFVSLQVPGWSLKGKLIYPATKILFYREMGGKGKESLNYILTI